MKNLATLLISFIISTAVLMATGISEVRETQKGESVDVSLVSSGSISLYAQDTEILPATIPQEPAYPFTKSYTAYYIAKGDGALTEVHCANYRKVLKKEMGDKPEIAGQIGSKGHQFPDLETLIEKYNQD